MAKSSVLLIGKRNRVMGIIFIGILLVLLALGIKYVFGIRPQAAGANCKYLISYGVSNNGAYPTYIRDNLSTIENMPNFPYDGVGIQTSGGTSPMYGITQGTINWTYAQLKAAYQPLFDLAASGKKPTKLKHNMLMAHLQDMGGLYTPGDAADKTARDAKWANVANNLAQMAKVAVDLNNAGFPVDGIFFDNEGPYSNNAWGNPPFYWVCGMAASGVGQTFSYAPGCSRTNAATLLAYQDQSRARGKQVMDAIKTAIGPTNYSKFKFMFMHSTDESCSLVPDWDTATLTKNWNQYLSDLQGAFELGLAESAYGTDIKVIDGGEESYGFRIQDVFANSYDFRHNTMPTVNDTSGKKTCLWIPTADQTPWSSLLQTAYAMYNKDLPSQGIPGQTVDTIGPSTKLALENSDNFVWFYVEGVTTIGYSGSTQIGQAWTDALKAARDAVPNDPSCDAGGPSPSPVSPPPSPSPPPPSPSPSIIPSPSTCVPPIKPSSFSAVKNATNPTTSADLSWTDTTADHDGFWIWRSTTAGTFPEAPAITLPDANMRSYTTTSLSPGTTYYFRIKSYKGSCFSDPVDAQVTTDPVGIILNLKIQLQGRTDYSTMGTHLKIYDSANALVLDEADVTTDASGNAQITLPTSMTVGATYSFYLKPKYFLADYKGNQILTNPMNLTYSVFKGGDANDDNVVNTLDFSLMNSKWLQSDPATDINKDGIVNTLDFAFLSANWLIGS